jgi:hypothetical protein
LAITPADNAKAVVLDFVDPIRSCRGLFGGDRKAGRERGHAAWETTQELMESRHRQFNKAGLDGRVQSHG